MLTSQNILLCCKLIQHIQELSHQAINIDCGKLANGINLEQIGPVPAEFMVLRNGKLGFGSAKMRETVSEFVIQNPGSFAAGTNHF